MWPLRTTTSAALLAALISLPAGAQFVPFPGKPAAATIGGGGNSARDCVADGGRIVSISDSEKLCQFDQASCPSGWSQRNNWTTTVPATCQVAGCSPCTTGQHGFANAGQETCSYANVGGLCLSLLGICYATIVQVGCQ